MCLLEYTHKIDKMGTNRIRSQQMSMHWNKKYACDTTLLICYCKQVKTYKLSKAFASHSAGDLFLVACSIAKKKKNSVKLVPVKSHGKHRPAKNAIFSDWRHFLWLVSVRPSGYCSPTPLLQELKLGTSYFSHQQNTGSNSSFPTLLCFLVCHKCSLALQFRF